jgi:hypothetical protein
MQHCSKFQRRKVVSYHVEPPEAWKLVVLNRWPLGSLCASCFDVEAEKARVQYTLVNVTGHGMLSHVLSRDASSPPASSRSQDKALHPFV